MRRNPDRVIEFQIRWAAGKYRSYAYSTKLSLFTQKSDTQLVLFRATPIINILENMLKFAFDLPLGCRYEFVVCVLALAGCGIAEYTQPWC